MALNTYSAFYYGHSLTRSNRAINFVEPSVSAAELTGSIDIGSFTLTEFGNRIAKALNTAGSQEYTVTLDRATRKFTISAAAAFELLIDTGSNKTVSAFTLMGFDGGVDLTGAITYEAPSPSGEAYITQTPLKNMSDFNKNKEKSEAQIKTTPGGITEVISYSILERLKADLPLITNYIPQRFIRSTVTGIEEAAAFMDYAIEKAPLEFIYDYKLPNNFVSCILDKTKASSKGVGYELKEKVKESLPGYYELNGLVFLKVEVR